MLTSLISVLPQTSHVPSVLPGNLWHFSSPHTFPRLCLLFLSLFKPPTLSLPPQELLAENFASHLRKLEQVSTITSTIFLHFCRSVYFTFPPVAVDELSVFYPKPTLPVCTKSHPLML